MFVYFGKLSRFYSYHGVIPRNFWNKARFCLKTLISKPTFTLQWLQSPTFWTILIKLNKISRQSTSRINADQTAATIAPFAKSILELFPIGGLAIDGEQKLICPWFSPRSKLTAAVINGAWITINVEVNVEGTSCFQTSSQTISLWSKTLPLLMEKGDATNGNDVRKRTAKLRKVFTKVAFNCHC